MTLEEYEWLVSDEATRAVAENRGRDPLEVALDTRVPHARLVATQVKYLHRAASKLPSYVAVQCILPPLAFEQASSERCAAHKRIGGRAGARPHVRPRCRCAGAEPSVRAGGDPRTQ